MKAFQELRKMVWKKPVEVCKDMLQVLGLSGLVIVVYWGIFMLLKDLI